MPRQNGLNDKDHPKPLKCPHGLGKIIGYTGDLNKRPTVYFTNGHYTQTYDQKWNVGWESCEGWKCLFFGNGPSIPEQDHISQKLPPADYVKELKKHGFKNRFKGGTVHDLRNWDLKSPDGDDTKELREFWIINQGNYENERFHHKSRSYFTPVDDRMKLTKLENQLSEMKTLPTFCLKREPLGRDFVVVVHKPLAPVSVPPTSIPAARLAQPSLPRQPK